MVSARFELATLEVKKVTGSIPNDDLLLVYEQCGRRGGIILIFV